MKSHQIDLSCLTEAEREILNAHPEVTMSGDTSVAVYMRFSSSSQSEQSIEGQLRDIISYCLEHKFYIFAIYIDRGLSAKTTEKRTEFLRMIADSEKRHWQYVLVWKLDRFARNRNDSALYKMRLSRNNVKVLSVTERISDSPEGIILESVLEGLAEFYSAELSQKIHRGIRESVAKKQSLGGQLPLGYKSVDKKLVPDPATSHIVQLAFELYASGWTVADICREFNTRGYRTSKGAQFNANSFKVLLRNKKYIGVYKYNGVEVENGMPPIISKELFYAVQKRLKEVGDAPGRGKAKVNYLLSGKLFCGDCGNHMTGDTGTGKRGGQYHYYTCHGKKKLHICKMKSLPKDWIEDIVVREAFSVLTAENIERIADIAVRQNEEDLAKNTRLTDLKRQLKTTEKSIQNICNAIEKGIASDTLMARLTELESTKKCVIKDINDIEKCVFRLDKHQVIYWLSQFLDGNIEEPAVRRQLINLLVNAVYVRSLPDDDWEVTITYNLTPQETKKVFGFETPCSTNERKSELLVVGTLCVQTKIHSLPR